MPMQVRLCPEADRWLTAAMVDEMFSLSVGRKYALMKRLIDPFPQPIRIGKSVRWLESKVLAWKNRQEQMSEVESMFADIEVNPQIKTRPVDSRAVAMKESYEAGASLDQICRKYRIGKQTLSDTLRAVGTQMRPVGRPSVALIRPPFFSQGNHHVA